MPRALRALEEERRAARLDGSVDDLGDLEVRVDLGGDANELALALEQADPVAQVGGAAMRSSLRRRGVPQSVTSTGARPASRASVRMPIRRREVSVAQLGFAHLPRIGQGTDRARRATTRP